MARNYLCTTQRARHPFYIESIGINIYSLEELCYYLYHYVYLIDETVMNERLCNWIGEELGLEKEKNLMLRALGRNEGANLFFQPVFQICRYLSDEELQHLQEQINGLQVESEDVRHKMKADYLLQFELYAGAIAEYEKILDKRSNGRLSLQFYADILENMATAYARMFRFEEAAEYLWDSYQTMHSRKVYEKYLKVLPLFLSPEKYEAKLEEIRANKENAKSFREETKRILLEGKSSEYAAAWKKKERSEQMEQLRATYVRNTTGTR